MLDNAFTPPMYRDTMSACINPMPYIDYEMMDIGCAATYNPVASMYGMGGFGAMPMGCGCAATNFLGGAKMKPQPATDTVELIKKADKENTSALKKALIYSGAFIAAAAVIGLFRGKYVQKFFKGLFGRSRTP